MPEFLSAAWLRALDDAAAAHPVDTDLDLTVQQIVVDGGTEVAYAIRIAEGRVAVVPGRIADADATFTQDRATAAAIARGSLSAQAAFIDGRLRVGGDLSTLVEHAKQLATLDDVFAPVRSDTEWGSHA